MAIPPPAPAGLVSIIIDNFNYGRFLAEAIDSALGQVAVPVEVIVVDDGSTDQSREVIRRYGDRLRSICQANGGQAAALNAGFAASHGATVIFLDADDVLAPTAAAAAEAALAANPTAARAHCRMEVIDAEGRRTGRLKPYQHLPLLQGDLRCQALQFPDDLPWLPTSGNAFRASLLRRIMPIPDADFRILADYYLSQVTPLFGLVIAIDEVEAFYRVHGGNNHEWRAGDLNLEQIRRTIIHWQSTHVYLHRYARELQLPGCPATADDVLSVSYVASRFVSWKFDPARHPLPGDTLTKLIRLGLRASGRRDDVSWPMKLMFMAWFLAMGLAPRRLARTLAIGFFVPESRAGLNRWLGRLHRGGAGQT